MEACKGGKQSEDTAWKYTASQTLPRPHDEFPVCQKDTLRVKELGCLLLWFWIVILSIFRGSKVGWSDLLAGNTAEYWPGCELKGYGLLRDGVQY